MEAQIVDVRNYDWIDFTQTKSGYAVDVFFQQKPDADVLSQLKGAGFEYEPGNGWKKRAMSAEAAQAAFALIGRVSPDAIMRTGTAYNNTEYLEVARDLGFEGQFAMACLSLRGGIMPGALFSEPIPYGDYGFNKPVPVGSVYDQVWKQIKP